MLGCMATGSRLLRRSLATAVTVLLLVLLAACGDDGGDTSNAGGDAASHGGDDHQVASPVSDDARHVRVVARSLEFKPKEIVVQAGEEIAIVLSSEDGLHDFTVDEFDAHVAAEVGRTSVGGFRAGEPGRYSFYCSVQGHREAGMTGILVVEG